MPLLLGARSAARALGGSRSEFYRLDATGRIPSALHLSKRKRWSVSSYLP